MKEAAGPIAGSLTPGKNLLNLRGSSASFLPPSSPSAKASEQDMASARPSRYIANIDIHIKVSPPNE